jgi:DNA-binding transcriptional regulator YhcF (GntR family)
MDKENKVIKSRIKIPIYERVLLFIITYNVDDELAHDEQLPSEAIVHVNSKGEIVIIIRPDANINTIAHESFHVTYEILKEAGLVLSPKSEEAFAYLNGYIAEIIDNGLKKYNK